MTSIDNAAKLRSLFRAEWLSAIRMFCDAGGRVDTFWSCEECLLNYFENGYFPVELDYGEAVRMGYLSHAETDAVAAFHAVVSAYRAPNDDYFDLPTIAEDPAWLAVVVEARVARRALSMLIKSEDERRLLSGE
jgi:hypothetical protein